MHRKPVLPFVLALASDPAGAVTFADENDDGDDYWSRDEWYDAGDLISDLSPVSVLGRRL